MSVVHFLSSLSAGDMGILGGIVLVVIWATRIYMKVGEISNIRQKLDQDSQKLDQMIATANEIWELMTAHEIKPFKTHGPTHLSDYGHRILESCDGSKIIDAYKDKVSLADDLNEYEIQETCVDFAVSNLESILKPDELAKVQKTAFGEGMPIETVLRVIGLELRNVVFKQRNLTFGKSVRSEVPEWCIRASQG